MMKLCTGFLLALLSVPSFGGEYDDYVVMKHAGTAWNQTTAWNWGEPVQAGHKYLVPADMYIYVEESGQPSFIGDELAVAGSFQHHGGWGSTFRNDTPIALLPGGSWRFMSFATKAYSPLVVRGTWENPSVIRIGSSSTSNYTLYPCFTYVSGADGFLSYCVVPDNVDGKIQYDLTEADFTGYLGTIRFADKGAPFSASSLTLPGTLEIAGGVVGSLTASDATSTFGTLRVGAGSTLHLTSANNTHQIAVATKLDLAAGSVLRLNKIDTFAIPTHETPSYKVFALSAAAAANGIPDFSGVAVDLGYTLPLDSNVPVGTTHGPLGLPTAAVQQDVHADGSVDVSVKPRPIVKFTAHSGWSKTPFKEDFDCTGYLSDDQPFHADADYYADGAYNIYVQDVGSKNVFPGHSLTFKGSSVAFYDSYEFPDLRIASGAAFRPLRTTQWPTTLTLSGNWRILGKGWATYGMSFSCRNRNGWKIAANVSGGELMVFEYFPSSDDSRDRWSGAVELTGDNSAFTGTMLVQFDPNGSTPGIFEQKGWAPFVPSFASNETLTVHNKANLGGALAAFDPAALTISDWCRLSFAETATFDEMTRGWTFPAHAALAVADGATATVRQTITCGDGAQLVKEGKGTLVLGGAINAGATAPTLTVSDGALGFAAADALANIGVTFAAGTALAVDATTADPDLKAKGLTVGSGTFPGSDKIPVAFDVGELGADDSLSVGVMTLADDAAADAMRARLRFKHVSRHRVTVTKVANGDGTVTLKADIEPAGVAIILR